MKAIFSAAYVIGKAGLISVDYEWVDYSNMEYDADVDIDYINRTNEDIEEVFHSVGNLHIGGEYRVSEYFSLRGGFEYFPSPYKSHALGVKQPNGDADTYTYSGGIGWKSGGFFADLAYKHVDSKNYINLYDVPVTANLAAYTSPTAKFENNDDYLTLTLGFRF
jgi:long-subunit fatty acid transport protein